MRTFSTIFFGLMMLPQAMHAQHKDKDKEGYALIKREGNISIYEKWTIHPSNPKVKAREVKGEFFYHNTVYAGLQLLQNESKAKEWQNHVSEFKVYPQRDTSVWYEYSYHDIPWPVSDQDNFMEYRVSVRKSTYLLINFRSKDNKTLAPLREGVTRMELSGSWALEQVGPGKVKVTYKVVSKPIDIPRFITDPIVRSNIMTAMGDFIAMLE